MPLYSYSRWDGAQQPFPFTEDDLMDQLFELLVSHGDIASALCSLSQREHSLDSVDIPVAGEFLGEGTTRDMVMARRMAELLERAGYIRLSAGRLELTPKGVRKIGDGALREIFSSIRNGRVGSHHTSSSGGGDELLQDTRAYQFGDAFHLDLHSSLMNALRRTPGTPVRMSPEDFEVHLTQQESQAATVLMLDLSLSMAVRGNFPAAKKVALALDNLIRTQFPRDKLHIVGFSTYAKEVQPGALAHLSWDGFDPYTNVQQGLALARKLLSLSHDGTRQIIMVSDGEPTAHVDAGRLFAQYPASPQTIHETLKEVKRCTRQNIKINTFMLERSSHVAEFVDRMAKINGGRVFYTSPNTLGAYVVEDYLSGHRKRLV